jgi:15-cis-phytoene synthase
MDVSIHRYIDNVTRNSKSSFYYTFLFLSPEKREAIHTIYSYCRISDDIVDNNDSTDKKTKQLDLWERNTSEAFQSTFANPYFRRLEEIRDKYRIPKEYFFELLKGMRMDLSQFEFKSFSQLKEYCYYVASIVGLMCIEIFGYKHEQTKEYAINLGIALQLTNMVRDFFYDKENGRLYFPQEDLEQFNITEINGHDSNIYDFLTYQINRAKTYYQKANDLLHPEDKESMVVAEMMNRVYYKLLLKIEKQLKKLPNEVIRLNKFQKIMISLTTFMRVKF